ncbi:MAG: F-type H+-transporting ATPase subunit b [Chthoniobacter sp.]|jgi:F-type H+-transporting ATPase subunit b|nr:F-type H+-transporting ATPase subunit b [Chthoniobacter sp.]
MNYLPLLAAEGGIIDSLTERAEDVGRIFGFNAWLFFSQIISFCIVAFLLQRFAYKPILTILETRRQKIAEGLANAEKIKHQLAESELRFQEILTKANAEGQRLIEEARSAAKTLGERESQRAIAEAEQIIVKAREATKAERDRELATLKKEIARLVIATTSKVTGKVLDSGDQRRITEEAARDLAA